MAFDKTVFGTADDVGKPNKLILAMRPRRVAERWGEGSAKVKVVFFTSLSAKWGFVFALAVCLAGCGGDGKGLVQVHGTITLAGKPMPNKGTIMFQPKTMSQTESTPVRPAYAKFEPDGSFRVQTFEPGDGMYPGKYGVIVDCYKVQPIIGGPPPISYIHSRYATAMNSGFEITVAKGESKKTFNIDVQPAGGEK